MSPEDLLKLLDRDGQDQPVASQDLTLTHPEDQKMEIRASPTALHLDEWGLRRGVDLLHDSEPLQQSLACLGNRPAQEHAAADFHDVAFVVEPILHEACVDPLRLQLLKQLLDTPEYRELHATTVLNEAASALASTVLARQYAQLRQERQEDEKHKLERKEGKSTAKDQAFREEIRVLRHVGQAVAEASREVEEAREAAAALGLGPGAPGSNDPKVVAALYRRVRANCFSSRPRPRSHCSWPVRFLLKGRLMCDRRGGGQPAQTQPKGAGFLGTRIGPIERIYRRNSAWPWRFVPGQASALFFSPQCGGSLAECLVLSSEPSSLPSDTTAPPFR
jgi:hypothetical protein